MFRCEAKLWRKVWQEAFFLIPERMRAWLKMCWMVLGEMGWCGWRPSNRKSSAFLPSMKTFKRFNDLSDNIVWRSFRPLPALTVRERSERLMSMILMRATSETRRPEEYMISRRRRCLGERVAARMAMTSSRSRTEGSFLSLRGWSSLNTRSLRSNILS